MRKELLVRFNGSEPVRAASIRTDHFGDDHDGRHKQCALMKKVLELQVKVSSLKSAVDELGNLRAALKELPTGKPVWQIWSATPVVTRTNEVGTVHKGTTERGHTGSSLQDSGLLSRLGSLQAQMNTQGASHYPDVLPVQQTKPSR